jgi:hypothetical protein
MVIVDLVLAIFSFTVYLLVLLVRPDERGQLLLGGIAGAVMVSMLIMLG